ncbi:DUF4433 domain-containing protein [Verminephrobacter eiseniae]|uniref:DUF4433 domain-containing protein n=1 Tax=Verminephrobacter eiseniae TaxID=364317 RepID=UPI002239075D|nr:DUF4433 domain-containing protein [Verminephrobacter eiseniae]MCW5230861.1 DUF4433 domain-containing protein [Verminephrobacter eiseniae]MCW5292594.1 DUF4433 domain-containing protein [Verminephrobacter eiseniae]MCW8185866.1 DUF4433 domain-containing protein [Verminephrobacter eiseniae]MCW8224533.1 DUF4433 domain-containing protein [Verminephrobacter eiseniae]MCW8235643.1 DUF4433 domain-containing protein [Verminephrobacter eiseniae]
MHKQIIQAHATEIKVPYLLHFTQVVNLRDIMKHGLYPIGRVNEIGVMPAINDQKRLDGHRNSTSVSISFPNCEMFYKYRQIKNETDWVVLALAPAVLWEKDCAFCRHNAASASIKGQPLLKTPDALIGMFEDHASREEQKLKTFDPTDVQAEVLVFDVIEPEYVIAAIFETAAIRDKYALYLGERKICLNGKDKGMFARRSYMRKYQ